MIICEHCHCEFPDDSIFCGQCGRRLKLPSDQSLNTRTHPGAEQLAVRNTPAFSQEASPPVLASQEQVFSAQYILEAKKEEEFEHELLDPFEPDQFSEKPHA